MDTPERHGGIKDDVRWDRDSLGQALEVVILMLVDVLEELCVGHDKVYIV